MRKLRGALSLLICLVLTVLPLSGCGQSAAIEPLTVTLLSVGKADAIVLCCGDETMVIDTGETDDGKELVNFLAWQERQKVDVLVITHFDKDHVGGAARLVKKMEVGRVILPDYEGENEEYAAFLAELAKKNLVPERLRESVSFSLGAAQVRVEPPEDYSLAGTGAEVDNDLSLITTVTHGSQRLLFTGDAEKTRLQAWLTQETREPCGFLKVPHHGDYNKALPELVETVKPQIAAICDSDKNPAEQRTLALLEREGAACYETKDGEIVIVSNGKSLKASQVTG